MKPKSLPNPLSSPSLSLFHSHKRTSLSTDKSFKASWDKPILKLLDFVNEHEEMYSVSSCSGRVSVMKYPGNQDTTDEEEPLSSPHDDSTTDAPQDAKKSVQKKYEASFGFVSHETVNFTSHWSQIKEMLAEAEKNGETVWFQQEPVIIHIRTLHLEQAMHLVHLFKTWGYKRSGLNTIKNQKFVIWLASTEEIKTILMRNGKYLITDDYLKVLIEEANRRLLQTHSKIQRAETGLLSLYMNQFSEKVIEFWFEGIKRRQRRETAAPICKNVEKRSALVSKWNGMIHQPQTDEEKPQDAQEEKTSVQAEQQPTDSMISEYLNTWPHLPFSNDFIVSTLGEFMQQHVVKEKHDWVLAYIIYLDHYAMKKQRLDQSAQQTNESEDTAAPQIGPRTLLDLLLLSIHEEINVREEFVPVERLFLYHAAATSANQQLYQWAISGLKHLTHEDHFVFFRDRSEIFEPFLKKFTGVE